MLAILVSAVQPVTTALYSWHLAYEANPCEIRQLGTQDWAPTDKLIALFDISSFLKFPITEQLLPPISIAEGKEEESLIVNVSSSTVVVLATKQINEVLRY